MQITHDGPLVPKCTCGKVATHQHCDQCYALQLQNAIDLDRTWPVAALILLDGIFKISEEWIQEYNQATNTKDTATSEARLIYYACATELRELIEKAGESK